MLVRLNTLKDRVPVRKAVWPDTRLILPPFRESLIISENANGELGSKTHSIRVDDSVQRLGKGIEPMFSAFSDSGPCPAHSRRERG